MVLQESGEMYLESILVLSQQKGYVRAVDISEYMGYSKPSVSRAVGLLKQNAYITIDSENHITLTPAGLQIAQKILDRHAMLTQFLTGLGVEPETASADACKIEHVISDESFEAIKNHIHYGEK